MKPAQPFVVAVLCVALAGTAFAQRKGRLKSDETTHIKFDANGVLVAGGDFEPMVIQTYKVDRVLLLVTAPAPDKAKLHYLAYSLEKGASPIVKVVPKVGPGCYWRQDLVTPSHLVHDVSTIRQVHHFRVYEGPMTGAELRCDGKSLICVPASDTTSKAKPILRTYDWDTLDDGK